MYETEDIPVDQMKVSEMKSHRAEKTVGLFLQSLRKLISSTGLNPKQGDRPQDSGNNFPLQKISKTPKLRKKNSKTFFTPVSRIIPKNYLKWPYMLAERLFLLQIEEGGSLRSKKIWKKI